MRWRRIFAVLAAVVVFVTTYELILPAITMDKRKAAEAPGVEIRTMDESLEEEGYPDDSLEQDKQYAEGTGMEFPDPAGMTTEETALEEQDPALDPENEQNTNTVEDSSGSPRGAENGSEDAGNETAAGTDDGYPETGSEASEQASPESEIAETENPAGEDAAYGSEEDGSFTESDPTSGIDETGETDQDPDTGTESAAGEAETGKNTDSKSAAGEVETGKDTDSKSAANGEETQADPDKIEPAYELTDETGAALTDDNRADSEMTANGNPAGTENAGVTDPDAANPDPDALAQPGTLTFEDPKGGYTITAAFDETAALPAGTQLSAVEILPGTVYKNENKVPVYAGYEEYYDKTLQALDQADRLGDRMLASTRFFDITFLDADGNPVEPAAPVSIAVKYKDAIEAGADTDTMAIHFDDVAIQDRRKQNKPEIGEAVLIETEQTVTESREKKEIEQVSFTNDKFSVYGVVYTVDFEYEKDGLTYGYSMEGGSSIRLSDVFEALKVEYALHGVPALPESSASVENSTPTENSSFAENSASVEDSESAEDDGSAEDYKSAEDSVSAGHTEGGADSETLTLTGRSLLDAVTGLSFSNPDLIRVTREETDGDWLLESLQPFDTQEQLVADIKDGGKIVIEVTDAQPISLKVGETTEFTPDDLQDTGKEGDTPFTWTIRSGSSAISISKTSQKTVSITGLKAGSATLQLAHSYYERKNNGDYKSKSTTETKTYAVTVAEADAPDPGDDSDPAFTDQEATAQEGSLADAASGSMTVTVKETGRLKKFSDYHVVVEDAADEYADDADMLRAYHIYLADKSGKEVTDLEKDLKNNQKLSLRVTITYDEEQDWFDHAKGIKHYKNGEEQTINGVTFGKDKKTICFNVRGFSDFVIRSGSTSTTGEGQAVTTQSGSILEGMTFNDANEWQIVSGEYGNNASGNKTEYGTDGNVRVQKNIIPTGVENEFFVYLGVDTKVTNEIIKTFIEKKVSVGNYFFGSASHFPGGGSETNGGKIYTGTSWNDLVQGTGKKAGDHYVTFNIKYQGVTIATLTLGCEDSNFQVYLKLSETQNQVVALGLGCAKKGELVGGPDVNLTSEAYQYLLEETSKTTTVTDMSVSDPLGEYITFLGVVEGNYASVPITDSDNVLHWQVSAKTNPKSMKVSSTEIWQLNSAELLYRVRLNVKQADFNSCAQHMNSCVGDEWSYPVNQQAILTYNSNQTAVFPDPYVRGLLYDVTGQKVDQDKKPIKNGSLKFTLSGKGVDGSDVTGIATETDGNGCFTIPGVQASQSSYTLTETEAPNGYAKKTDPKTVSLNYTNARDRSVYEAVSDTGHMKLKDDSTTFVFENEFTVVNLKLTKKGTDTGAPLLGNATFKLEKMKEVEGTLVVDTSWGTLSGTTGDSDDLKGVLKWESTSEKPISPGFYQITETTAPSGYILNNNPVIIQVKDDKTISMYGETGAGVYEVGQSVTEESGTNAKVFETITAGDDPIRIAVKKVGASGTGSEKIPIGGVRFTLTDVNDKSFSDITSSTVGDDQGFIFWEKVPVGTYTLTEDETTVPEGYKPSLSATVVINADGTIGSVTPIENSEKPDATNEITIAGTKDVLLENGKTAKYQTIQVVNRKTEVNVIIRKTDSNGDTTSAGATTATKFLAGAQFTVYDEADQPVETMNTLLNAQSDEFGYVTKSVIDPDSGEVTETTSLPMESGKTYYLEENKAPDGYNLPEGKYKLVVGDAGISIYNYSKAEGGYRSIPSKTYSIEEGVCTVIIQNTAGQELPHTGGTGFISPLTLCAIMAMAFVLATALMYGFGERRGERRHR